MSARSGLVGKILLAPFGAISSSNFLHEPKKSKTCQNFADFPWWANGPYSPSLGSCAGVILNCPIALPRCSTAWFAIERVGIDRIKGSWLLGSYLIPGCLGRGIKLGSESSSGIWKLGIKKQKNKTSCPKYHQALISREKNTS